ncbi:MAG: tRNA pseudouridine(38-40) synthase TruA [Anaerolineales bacterium]
MAHYKAILAYDGNRYSGFQRQKKESGCITVQAVVETALAKIGWQDETILFAGRTDTGVHASGQVIAFQLNWTHSLWELQSAINANLPADIAVLAVEYSDKDFHPRYQAVWRQYRYRIYYSPQRHPLYDRYAWRIWPAPDFQSLQNCALLLIGEHNFGSFGRSPKFEGSTIRNVFLASWSKWEDMDIQGLHFDIRANAFLYHMVRRIVAQMVRVGQGSMTIAEFEQALKNTGILSSHHLAPARGLTLVKVYYGAYERIE